MNQSPAGKYLTINEQKDLTASTTSLTISQTQIETKLQQFNSANHQAAIASFHADLMITVALFLMVNILLLMRLFFSQFDFRELSAYFGMFGISILIFGIKSGYEELMKSQYQYGQISTKLYSLEAKCIDICLFVVAWLAPIEPIAGLPILNYVLTIPVLYVLYDMLTECQKMEKVYIQNKIQWLSFILAFIVIKLAYPAAYEGQNISVIHFFAIYDIWSAVCQIPRLRLEGRPRSKQGLMDFLYNHANNSIGLRIVTLPMFTKVPLGFMFGVLAQSVICLFFRFKYDKKTVITKFLNRHNNNAVKLSSNTLALHRNDALIGANPQKIQLAKQSTLQGDFTDELCCICVEQPAEVVIASCRHCYMCVKCKRKEVRKARVRRNELKCVICGENQGNQFLKLSSDSSKYLIDGLLGAKFKGQFVTTMHGYTVLAL